MTDSNGTPPMRKGTFADQMGALAIVDKLRHRQMDLEGHLDIRQRKKDVAEGIRNHYLSQGITFDERQIEDGVRDHFAKRLRFQPPKLNFLELMVAKRMVRRWGTLMLLIWVAYLTWHIESRRFSEQATQPPQTPPAATTPVQTADTAASPNKPDIRWS